MFDRHERSEGRKTSVEFASHNAYSIRRRQLISRTLMEGSAAYDVGILHAFFDLLLLLGPLLATPGSSVHFDSSVERLLSRGGTVYVPFLARLR